MEDICCRVYDLEKEVRRLQKRIELLQDFVAELYINPKAVNVSADPKCTQTDPPGSAGAEPSPDPEPIERDGNQDTPGQTPDHPGTAGYHRETVLPDPGERKESPGESPV
jgi:hypothetical protein